MEMTRQVLKWGNSAGILLPKEFIGKEAKIIIIDRTGEIKKEVFSILDKKLNRILGIYLVGSYARNEQNKSSDIDILAISDNISIEIISDKYHISIVPINIVKNVIKVNPILIMPRIAEAKPLLNTYLLSELRQIKLTKKLFLRFITDSRRMMQISKELIELDKLDSEYLKSVHVIYSLILRLRGLFMINCLLSKKLYTHKNFLLWLSRDIGADNTSNLYNIYKKIKSGKAIKDKIRIEIAEKLLNLLCSELKKW